MVLWFWGASEVIQITTQREKAPNVNLLGAGTGPFRQGSPALMSGSTSFSLCCLLLLWQESEVLMFLRVCFLMCMCCTFCLPTIWAMPLEFCRIAPPTCWWIKCREHACQKISPAKRSNFTFSLEPPPSPRRLPNRCDPLHKRFPFSHDRSCNRQIVGLPREENHDQMSDKCPECRETPNWGSLLEILPFWSLLLFSTSVQRVPVTRSEESGEERCHIPWGPKAH